jgi:hypothetical protein
MGKRSPSYLDASRLPPLPPRGPRVSERLDGGMSRQVFPACWVRSVFIAVTSPYALMRLSTEWAILPSFV